MSRERVREGRLRVGTSGYQYDDWRGVFYPADLPKKRWFEHYGRCFDAIELNSTFYRVPDAAVFEAWRRQAPAGFEYTLKYSRFGTQMKRLKDPADQIAYFMERARGLGPTLGPILVQLPPRWRVDVGRLEAFLEAAPAPQRWAVELRDERWLCAPVFEALRRHNAALVVHDRIRGHPDETTADWVYLRFHGPEGDYQGSYGARRLAATARRIRAHLEAGRDVYAFFNNDVGGHAPRDALALRRRITPIRG